ncbi:hypothetical protein D0T53_04905 [Dysgonomonas sp. 216]|uniref:T9SS type A sorting domain-containing protein n=1 Tax=Dysgonomonas sp. 216 TaxID=2302934 RepID=UPI0013D57436|nr:T9SS type A sorting domain-containing protein [Dysgonomonas sp. 216]NDW18258.1 hypothetical protein [Dysgonomonas sp. 216]
MKKVLLLFVLCLLAYTTQAQQKITFTWDSFANGAKSVSLRATAGTDNITVDWGDGTIAKLSGTGTDASTSVTGLITYTEAKSYTVTITADAGTDLTYFSVYLDMNLRSLDVSKATKLTSLICRGDGNWLTELDVSMLPELETLYCFSNRLKKLKISEAVNTKLKSLLCYKNRLPLSQLYPIWANKNISTSKNIDGQSFTDSIMVNAYTDLSSELSFGGVETQFTLFVYNYNSYSWEQTLVKGKDYSWDAGRLYFHKEGYYKVEMTNPNVRNGTSDEGSDLTVTAFYLVTPPAVTFTWAGSASSKRFSFRATSGTDNVVVDWGNGTQSTYSGGGDESPKAAWVTYGDTKSYTVSISTVKGSELTMLSCFDNQLSALDVTNNPALRSLSCYKNQLSALDVTNNPALSILYCFNNHLSALDVTNNPALSILYCFNNQLSALDVTNNPALTALSCDNNQLSALDVTNNPALTALYCDNNQLSALDVTNNPALSYLDCYNNQLSALDVTNNPALTALSCFYNQLPLTALYAAISNGAPYTNALSISPQTLAADTVQVNAGIAIPVIDGTESEVTVVNATAGTDYTYANGTLTFFKTGEYTVTMTNSKVVGKDGSKAEVRVTYTVTPPAVTFTWTGSASSKSFSFRATSGTDNVVVDWGNGTQSTYSGDDRAKTASVTYGDTKSYTVSISTVKGSELTLLSCFNNQLSALDVTNNPALRSLDCYNNQLRVLDVTNNPALRSLSCFNNQLSALDVTNNPALTALSCSNNQLSALDVTNNPVLSYLSCSNNQLSVLDVTNNPALSYLYCDNNQLSALDVTNNPALTDLSCSTNQLSALDVTNNPALRYLSCSENQLSVLDVTNNPALRTLYCDNNQLSALDVTNNPALSTLYCDNNQLSALDVTNNPALSSLYCTHNQLPLTALYAAISNGAPYADGLSISPQTLAADTVQVNAGIAIPVIDGTESEVTAVNATAGTDYTYANGTLTFLNTGEYTVIMTNSKVVGKNGYKAEVSVTYTVEGLPVGIGSNNSDVFSVYPNPVSDVLYIKAADVRQVDVYNVQGVEVISLSGNIQKLDMSSLTPNSYVVIVRTTDRLYRAIVVKK